MSVIDQSSQSVRQWESEFADEPDTRHRLGPAAAIATLSGAAALATGIVGILSLAH